MMAFFNYICGVKSKAMIKREIIYDIITILTKAGYTDDSNLNEDWVGYKVDEKRAKEIRDSYNRTPLIDPMWIQDYGICDVTKINTADDKTFNGFACEIGKLTLPPVVSFGNSMAASNNLGIYSMRGVSGQDEIYFEHLGKLMEIDKLSDGNILKNYKRYAKIHNACYFLPYLEKVHPYLILERPLDGYVISSENIISGNLVIGTSYTVMTYQIIHNGIAYNSGNTFVAVNTLFTGSGTVQLLNQKRRMTDEDEYPMSSTMAEIVITKILLQDYKIEASQIADIKNDSADSLKVLQPDNGQ